MTMTTIDETSRAKRLKTLTRAVHDRLDASIMKANAFADVDGYVRFLRMQWAFHRDIEALYGDPALTGLLPDLAQRRRAPLIEADLRDLGAAPQAVALPQFDGRRTVDIPTALGWLYVAEGSNIGAALLRMEAARIGLSDSYGARHLAPASEGPAAYWRQFIAALDAVDLTSEQEARVVAGVNDAFMRVQSLADAIFA